MKDLLKSRAAGIVYIVIAIALVALWITYLNRWNIALSSIDFSPRPPARSAKDSTPTGTTTAWSHAMRALPF